MEHEETACTEEVVKTNSSKFVLLCILYVRQQSKFGKLVNIAISSVVKSDHVAHACGELHWMKIICNRFSMNN